MNWDRPATDENAGENARQLTGSNLTGNNRGLCFYQKSCIAMENRIDVSFLSDGKKCRAWLYLPEGGKKRPVVVLSYRLGAIR